MIDEYEGIYLLKEREFVRCGDDVFKIGRSSNLKNRVKQYPKESDLHVIILCKDSITVEKYIINLFNDKFNRMKDYGAEYFKGNLNDFIVTLQNYMKDYTCIFYKLKNSKTHSFNFKNIKDNKDVIKTIYKAKTKVNNNNNNNNNNINNNNNNNNKLVNNNIILKMQQHKGILHKCILCKFSTSKKCGYDRHILTKKHIDNIKNIKNIDNISINEKIDILLNKIDNILKSQKNINLT